MSPAGPAAAGTANTAGPPTLTHAVQPTYAAGNITSCPAGTTTFINTSDSNAGDQSASYSHNITTFQATVNSSGNSLSFTTNSPSFTVYVKGGPAYDTYDYTGTKAHPAYSSDRGLHSPYNNGGNIAKISHYLVCGQPAKASPTLTTTPSAGGTAGSVVLNDTGSLSGGASPTGSITFNLYAPSDTTCSGTPAYTQTVPVTGDSTYSTTNTTAAKVAGTWRWTATYSGDAGNNGVSSACGQETVTVTAAVAQGSCEGSGLIATLVSGTTVSYYVPKGNWLSTTTGIDVVTVEGGKTTSTLVSTGTDVINSCASNSVTGQTVCTANNNHVYVLKGTGLDPSVSNPLTDSGSGTISFSGGTATTSGVSMDATDNKALIALSVGGTAGFQFLDLATGTFEPAFTTQDPGGQISEDPLIDPVHHLILSPAEDNNFELVNVATSTSPQFFEHPVSGISSGILDSAAEDCSTGISFAPAEFSDPSQVEIADITKPNAVFTPGTPGSWTAPEQVQTLTGSSLSAGPSGSAVAQGTHTGVISGEFGGDSLTALALPTTSGSGAVPSIGNWVTCQTGPDPSGNTFSMGDDPHTMTAYQSPNSGDAIALLVNEGATELVRIDLTAMLNPATVPATGHVCNSGTLPSSTTTFIPLP